MNQSFGVKLPGSVPRWAASYAQVPDLVVELEQMGFDDVMDGEHVLFMPTMEHPGGAGSMRHERTEQHSDRADTLITFAAIAARTSRINLVSSILLPPLHGFGVLARQAATLDVISGGRFHMGVGQGWNAAEFRAQGVPPKERDARAEETMRACLELWSPGLSSFTGEWIDFSEVICEPAPATAGGPPIWWGGPAQKGRTSLRVAEFCKGWLSREAADDDELAGSVDAIRAECDRIGRDPDTVSFRCTLTPTSYAVPGSTDQLIEEAVASGRRRAALGITHFTVPLNYYGLELEDLERLLKELRAA